MIITVDCNNDTLTIAREGFEDFEYDLKEPSKILKILEEIFNGLSDPHEIEEKGHHSLTLEQINENKRHTIGEW